MPRNHPNKGNVYVLLTLLKYDIHTLAPVVHGYRWRKTRLLRLMMKIVLLMTLPSLLTSSTLLDHVSSSLSVFSLSYWLVFLHFIYDHPKLMLSLKGIEILSLYIWYYALYLPRGTAYVRGLRSSRSMVTFQQDSLSQTQLQHLKVIYVVSCQHLTCPLVTLCAH